MRTSYKNINGNKPTVIMDIQEMARLGKSTCIPMHAKNSEENIHATRYLHSEPDVDVDHDVLFRFPSFPLLS